MSINHLKIHAAFLFVTTNRKWDKAIYQPGMGYLKYLKANIGSPVSLLMPLGERMEMKASGADGSTLFA